MKTLITTIFKIFRKTFYTIIQYIYQFKIVKLIFFIIRLFLKIISKFAQYIYLTIEYPYVVKKTIILKYNRFYEYIKSINISNILNKLYTLLKDFIYNMLTLSPLRYLNFIYKLIIYFNALFGFGIIIFYVSPVNEILNNIIQFINYYSDNKFYDLLRYIKNLLDYFSEWINNIIKQDVKLSSDINSDDYIKEAEEYELNKYNLRKEYSNTDSTQNIEINKNNWLKYTLAITGVILIIGITCYNWDTLINYFTSSAQTNSSTPKNRGLNITPETSPISESQRNYYFTSPEASIPSSPSSSGSSTITLGRSDVIPSSPEPLPIKLRNLDSFNPSYPNPDSLTDTMVEFHKNFKLDK
jgi:hypothetical protein